MSISSMANVAYVRRTDVATKHVAAQAAPKSARQIESATEETPDSQSSVTTALRVIVTYIPTEVLTLYIAVVAALQDPTRTTRGAFWVTFYIFLVATPLVVWFVYAAKVSAAKKPLPLRPRVAHVGDVCRRGRLCRLGIRDAGESIQRLSLVLAGDSGPRGFSSLNPIGSDRPRSPAPTEPLTNSAETVANSHRHNSGSSQTFAMPLARMFRVHVPA